MYSLLFNQVWVHTVFSPLAMTCPDLLTSIQPLLFAKPSGTMIIFETSYPSVELGWNWPTSSNVFAGSQTDTHKKITPASFPWEFRLKSKPATYSDSVLLHLQPVLHSEIALVANGSCQWPCIDKLPPKCSWCDLFLPSLTSQPTSWKKVTTSQTDRKRQAEIARSRNRLSDDGWKQVTACTLTLGQI